MGLVVKQTSLVRCHSALSITVIPFRGEILGTTSGRSIVGNYVPGQILGDKKDT